MGIAVNWMAAGLLAFTIFFYIVGTILESTSLNIVTFATGGVFQQIGLTTCILIIEIIISDITSMRSRVFLLYTYVVGVHMDNQKLTYLPH